MYPYGPHLEIYEANYFRGWLKNLGRSLCTKELLPCKNVKMLPHKGLTSENQYDLVCVDPSWKNCLYIEVV